MIIPVWTNHIESFTTGEAEETAEKVIRFPFMHSASWYQTKTLKERKNIDHRIVKKREIRKENACSMFSIVQ